MLDGLGIHWLEWGRKDAPVIMCIHGSWGTAESFTPFAQHACVRHRVIAPDLRGHGQSDWVEEPGGYLPEKVAGDIVALMTFLNVPAAHLIGLSLGGLVACQVADMLPAQLRSLTLVDIAPSLPPDVEAGLRAGFNYPLSFASLDAAVAWACADELWTQGPALRDDLHSRLRQRDDGQWTWRADARFFEASDRLRWFDAREQFWGPLERARQPVLLMRAGRSPLIDDEVVAEFQARVPTGRVAFLPDAQHSIPISDPGAFTREFSALLDDLE